MAPTDLWGPRQREMPQNPEMDKSSGPKVLMSVSTPPVLPDVLPLFQRVLAGSFLRIHADRSYQPDSQANLMCACGGVVRVRQAQLGRLRGLTRADSMDGSVTSSVREMGGLLAEALQHLPDTAAKELATPVLARGDAAETAPGALAAALRRETLREGWGPGIEDEGEPLQRPPELT